MSEESNVLNSSSGKCVEYKIKFGKLIISWYFNHAMFALFLASFNHYERIIKYS